MWIEPLQHAFALSTMSTTCLIIITDLFVKTFYIKIAFSILHEVIFYFFIPLNASPKVYLS